eukprot:PITA_10245
MERGRRGRGRGARRIAEEGLKEEIRIVTSHLEAVEARRRRDPEVGDDNEEEAEASTDGPKGETPEVRLLRSILVASSKPKPELPTYDGSISIEVLLDWMSEMDKYFECEEVSEDHRVRFASTKLKGHAALWWDSVQTERKRLNKLLIKTWSRMVDKLKGRFLPKDYQISLHRQVQNLKHKGMMNTEEAYQSAMKAKEKITRRQNTQRGRGVGKGKGQSYGKGWTTSSNEQGSSSRASGSADIGDNARGSRSSQRGRGNGRGRGAGYQCYRCHKWGHRSFECPEADQVGQRGAYVAQPEEAATPSQEAENAPEIGEALVLNKRSTDNLVSTEMVENLELKCLKHPTPYKVSWLQKGHQLLVDEQCEVEFQIGRYQDKVVCDIMPLDVCHILLGRPWQYDRKVVHDGLTICYKFVKDGIKHMLVPIKEEGIAGTSEPRALLVSGK